VEFSEEQKKAHNSMGGQRLRRTFSVDAQKKERIALRRTGNRGRSQVQLKEKRR